MKKVKTPEIKPLMTSTELLTTGDIQKLEQVAKLKVELKRLEADLKPKIRATVEQFGTGMMVIGTQQVKLSATDRDSVSWKSLAHALSSEEEINSVVDNFTVTSTSYGAKAIAAAPRKPVGEYVN